MRSTNQYEAYGHDTNLSGLWGMVAARASRVLGHRGSSGRSCSVDAFQSEGAVARTPVVVGYDRGAPPVKEAALVGPMSHRERLTPQ